VIQLKHYAAILFEFCTLFSLISYERRIVNSLIYFLVFVAIHCINLATAHPLIINQIYLTVLTINTALLIHETIQTIFII
jgi:hypothetical protein